MTSITRMEARAGASLLVLAAVFWWFQMRMLDGMTVVDQSAGKLLGVYVVVIAAMTVAEIIIATLTSGAGGRIERDERDSAIEARANQNERLFIIAAVNVLIWQALMEGAFAGHVLPTIDLTSLPVLFFWLFAVLFGGEIVKRLSTIWLYRIGG